MFPASISGAAYRLIHCTKEFTPPPKYQIELSPGNKEIVKGENIDVRVKVTSLFPGIYTAYKGTYYFSTAGGTGKFR